MPGLPSPDAWTSCLGSRSPDSPRFPSPPWPRGPVSRATWWWNSSPDLRVDMVPLRFGFGDCMARIGGDPRIVALHADISASIKITDFEKDRPERLKRVVSVGIAEQDMMSVAAGLALEGMIPVAGTYGVFAAGRPWDQIRTTICYDNLNVKIAGAHGGISVGQDGATHQALEEIALMNILPNMNLVLPCDSLQADRLCEMAILDVDGPAYMRLAREATPVVTRGRHSPGIREGERLSLPGKGGALRRRLRDAPRRRVCGRGRGHLDNRLRGRWSARRCGPRSS